MAEVIYNISKGSSLDPTGYALAYNINQRINSSYHTVKVEDNIEGTTGTLLSLDNMFNGSNFRSIPYNLYNLDISNLNTSRVTSTRNMCQELYYLKNISNFDTGLVVDAARMFRACSNLVDIPNYNFARVKNASQMFQSCSKIQNIPELYFTQLENSSYMFASCGALTNAEGIRTWDMNSVTDMSYMFQACPMTSLELPPTPKVNNLGGAFYGTGWLTTLGNNTSFSDVRDMSYSFYACNSLTDMSNISFPNADNTYQSFSECKKLTTAPNINEGTIVNAYAMFSNCYSLIDVSNINTCNTTYAAHMFANCNSLPVVNCDFSKITDGFYMFYNCRNLETVGDFPNLARWT